MSCFPFFMELEGKEALVIGGGRTALGKVRALLPYGPRLTVAAPEVLPELEALPGLVLLRRPFREADLDGKAFAVAAGDRAVNRQAAALCRARGLPVNVVDDPAACTFYFPALLKRGPLTVGVSTSGASPSGAAWVRDRVADALPEALGDILAFLGALRPRVKAAIPEGPARQEAFASLFRRCLEAGRPLTEAETEACLGRPLPDPETRPVQSPLKPETCPEQALPEAPGQKTGKVWLVGAGCGPDLLTLRGLRALAGCQAVVYDGLVDRELLDFAPPDAERLWMGKRAGGPSTSQEAICETLIRLAREGKTVVRLKGGDPYVFGRGGEEMLALLAAGVACEEVPGVTSAIAVPAAAGIPVTHRRVSRSVHIVTAWREDGGLPEDLGRLAGLEGTLVFLMGLGRLEALVQGLLEAGKAPETPGAVISGARGVQAVRGPLEALPALAREAALEPPAVIVVGPAAALDLTGGSSG